MTTVVGVLLGLAALAFGIVAIVAPARLASRFRDRDSWMIEQDKERPFSPRSTQIGGVIVGLAGLALLVLAALGFFG